MSYQASNLPSQSHLFCGREGGVSQGKYASLNVRMNSLDKPDNVLKNREIAVGFLGEKINNLVMLRQVSKTDVVLVKEASQGQIVADGMVCKQKGLVLGIGTADCLPLLLRDEKHGVIGAAHAGWRGAVRGVIENTLTLMCEQGAKREDIAAATGPCIQQASFEVGEDVRDECLALSLDYGQFFKSGKDEHHFQFDLESLVTYRLRHFGVENVTVSGIDTYTDESYFSFRREKNVHHLTDMHDFGGHVSLIKL